MRPRFKIVTAELALSDGLRRGRSACIRVVSPTEPENRARGMLGLLAEGVRDDELAQQALQLVLETVEGHYYISRSRSATTRLVQGIEAAESRLQRTMPDFCRHEEGGLGVSCVAIVDGVAYVAQTPPATAAVVHQEQIEPIGAEAAFKGSDWMLTQSYEIYNSLGTPRPATIEVSEISLTPGDTLALFSPSLARLLPLDGVRDALSYQEAGVGVDRLHDLATRFRARSGASLVIEIGGALVPDEAGVEDDGGPAEDPPGNGRAAARRGSMSGWLRSLGRRIDEWVWIPRWSRAVKPLPDMPAPRPGPPVVAPGTPVPRRRPGLERWTWRPNWAGKLRQLLDRPIHVDPERRPPKHPAVYIALLVCFLAAGGAGLVWQRHLRAERARFDGLLTQAALVEKEALATPDKAAARPLFARALELGQQAQTMRVDAARSGEVLKRLNDELDRINGVVYVRPRPLLDLSSDRGAASIVPYGRTIYVLDGPAQQIVAVGAEGGQPQVVLRKGDRVGMRLVGGLKQLVQAAQKLAALDEVGTVWTFDLRQQSWVVLPVHNEEPLKTAVGFDFYGTNMYALQPRGGVNKWAATERGFDLPPSFYIKTDPAAGTNPVVAMSIDGTVLLMRRDGSVVRYLAGDRQEFAWRGLDRPLNAPSAIWSSPVSDSIYVADAGNRRVVEFDRDGHLQRQIVPGPGEPGFNDLRQVAVGDNNRLYVAAGSRLYSIIIPQA